MSDYFSVKILKKVLVTIFVKKKFVIKKWLNSAVKKSVTFYRRESRVVVVKIFLHFCRLNTRACYTIATPGLRPSVAQRARPSASLHSELHSCIIKISLDLESDPQTWPKKSDHQSQTPWVMGHCWGSKKTLLKSDVFTQ